MNSHFGNFAEKFCASVAEGAIILLEVAYFTVKTIFVAGYVLMACAIKAVKR